MRMLLSFAALFLSVALLQLSSGAVAPLDALSGAALGFSTPQIGLLGSAHFTGFFVGCWWAPRLIGVVGHSRAFAVFTATGAIALLAHMLVIDPRAWAVMRIGSGLCVAGCYTVIEAWLNAKLSNENRGRATGAYRAVDLGASLVAQGMIGVLAPASYVSYNLLAIVCCAAILPLALTTVRPPETPDAPRLRPMLAVAKSPLGAAAVVIAGLTSATVRTIGPVFGQGVGLTPGQIGLFLVAFVGGGALAQIPAGWIADRIDRRIMLTGLSLAAMGACAAMAVAAGLGPRAVIAAAALFGFATFPIFSLAAAHAHDFATASERVELSAALMFLFAVGAIGAPLAASGLIDRFGPAAMVWMIGAAHAALVAYGLTRFRARPTVPDRTAYVYTPRTSFTLGRLFARRRDRDD